MIPRTAVALALCALLVTPTAFAQDIPEGAYVRTSSGDVFLIQNGQRVRIVFTPMTDEQITAIPISSVSPSPQVQWQQSSWVQVAQFSGKGSKTTEPFTVGQRWRIVVDVKTRKLGSTEFNQLCVTANNLDPKKFSSVDGCSEGPFTTNGYEGGTFALDVYGVNDGWTVTVEEFR